jgi:hypothetical protein
MTGPLPKIKLMDNNLYHYGILLGFVESGLWVRFIHWRKRDFHICRSSSITRGAEYRKSRELPQTQEGTRSPQPSGGTGSRDPGP